MMRRLLVKLILVFFLASCSQPPAPVATGTPTAAIPPTDTPTFTHSPSNTFTQTPSHTRSYPPSRTPDWSRIATIEALFTKVYSFPDHCPPDYIYYGSSSTYDSPISPDGNWVINPCQRPSETSLEVIRLDGTKTWSISNTQLLTALSLDPKNFYDYGIIPIHWTKDSRQVYFFLGFCCVESSDWPHYGTNFGPLFQLDVQTGIWAVVVASLEDYHTYSFSPTDRRLLYIKNGRLDRPLPLHILDLKTGALDLVEIPSYDSAGSVVWSPDGLTFAFGAVHTESISDTNHVFYFSVFAYQLESKTLKSLITLSPTSMCSPTDWSADSRLTLSCLEYDSDYHTILRRYTQYYDLNTGSLFTPSPTP